MDRYKEACFEIDKVHWLDENYEEDNGIYYPSEMLYSIRMIRTMDEFKPDAQEVLKIAARCQHFRRWEIQRNTYPMDKVGYLRWRKELYVYQSEEAAKVLIKAGYDEGFVDEFKQYVQKKDLKKNEGTQLIEDVACLVFIKYYLEDFSKKHEHDKLLSIIAKTWNKMSENAKEAALKIELPDALKNLVVEAIK